jgi:hypothetical protein
MPKRVMLYTVPNYLACALTISLSPFPFRCLYGVSTSGLMRTASIEYEESTMGHHT